MGSNLSPKRMSWAEMLDVLTDSDRRRNTILQKPSEVERLALFLLRRENWSAQLAAQTQKNYDLELFKPGERVAVQVRNHRSKVHLGQVEKFIEFLNHSNSGHFSNGVLISTSGFTPSVYVYLREEKIASEAEMKKIVAEVSEYLERELAIAEEAGFPEPISAAYNVFDNSVVKPAFKKKVLEN